MHYDNNRGIKHDTGLRGSFITGIERREAREGLQKKTIKDWVLKDE